MNAFRSVAALLLVLALAVGRPAGASVEDVCEKATKGSEYYGYCVSSLKSAVGSGKGDALSLAVAATASSQKQFSNNLGRIKALLGGGGLDKPSERALRACDNVYTRGLMKLQQAGDRLQSKDFYGASNYLSTARDDAVSCGDVFTKFGIKSLMQAENDETLKRCYVAIHVAQQLN